MMFRAKVPKQDLRERVFSYLFLNYVDLSSAIIFKSKSEKKEKTLSKTPEG